MIGVTENLVFTGSGSQYGMVRFYDIATNPAAPKVVAQERLSEAWSGVPDRLVMANGYAYVVTLGAGLQVVSVEAARVPHPDGFVRGEAVVGGYDTYAGGYSGPFGIAMVNNGTLLLATGTGNLLILDARRPPQVELIKDMGKQIAFRVGGASGLMRVNPATGAEESMDVAVSVYQGKVSVVDITTPVTAAVVGSLVLPLASVVNDIVVNARTGLAFVTGGSVIYVIDLKDPMRPKLINTVPIAGGYTSGLVEKDG
ncbi:MAG: hypothetical protein HY886_07125, partial [Deltaproteobacteria bacterium]|nr:hypothetical protein [Deltaproteobacteria bacterium]